MPCSIGPIKGNENDTVSRPVLQLTFILTQSNEGNVPREIRNANDGKWGRNKIEQIVFPQCLLISAVGMGDTDYVYVFFSLLKPLSTDTYDLVPRREEACNPIIYV